MTKVIESLARRIGMPPGTISDGEPQKGVPLRLACLEYNRADCREEPIDSMAAVPNLMDSSVVTWVNIEGVTPDLLKHLKELLGIHPLVLEDIMHTDQRPKIEDHGGYILVILKMVYEGDGNETIAEQVSLILGPHYVLSFQERPGDVFEAVRNRIRSDKGQIRRMNADYLAYALLDAVVDNYFVVMEGIGSRIEEIDDQLMQNVQPEMIQEIHTLKRDLIFLRRQIWPLREVVNSFQRNDSNKLIKPTTRVYMRDVYDNAIQVMDAIESFRDIVSGLHDVYLSMMSNRMNEIMKVLTIFAAIFIPLTFIAGIYGMNFKYMPELEWQGGYYAVLALMIAVAVGMLVYFKRQKWF